jgi:thioesterase domain-containing protein
VGVRHDFFLLGGHSLLAARMIAQVGEIFDRRLDFASLSQAATIEHLADILRTDKSDGEPTSLVPIRAKGDRQPLFCVHGVGGHILPFLQLASHLDSKQPVYGLQAKPVEKGKGEDGERTIEGMASQYIVEIERVQPAGPYCLAGFSFGGFLAFEMARQMIEKGQKVALLAIFDSQVRGLPGYRRALSASAYTHFVAKSYLEKVKYRLKSYRLQSTSESFRNLERQDNAPLNQKEIILGDVAEEEVPEYLKAVMEANLRALLSYVPKSYPGKLILFKSLTHGQGVHYGWGELARGGVEDHYVPGSHRGIMQEPNVAILADQLQKCIDSALES